MITALLAALAGPAPEAARIDRLMAAPARTCSAEGVTVRGGKVTGAGFFGAMAGFAADAGTTGGLGRQRLLVTRAEDPAGGARPGTLRAAVEQAGKTGGGWIAFAPALRGAAITLSAPLRVGSNVTIDGGCAQPRITGTARGSLIYLRGSRNVVITRLSMEHASPGTQGDCITVSHGADRVWLAFLRLRKCRDGLIDVTRDGVAGPMRVTLSNNRFLDHDKAILAVGGPVARDCTLSASPVRLTIYRNVFLRTGQRHPRVSGDVFVDLSQNVISFAPRKRADGRDGGSYGTLASNGARVLVDETVYLPPAGSKGYRIAAVDAQSGEAARSACSRGRIEWVRSTVAGSGRIDAERPDVPSANRPYRLGRADRASPQALIDHITPLTGPGGTTGG